MDGEDHDLYQCISGCAVYPDKVMKAAKNRTYRDIIVLGHTASSAIMVSM
jgi:hypothetical protein